MDAKSSLERLGLTKNEASVYATLLALGITKAGEVIRRTKLHRMLVYNALESLISKDLVSVAHKSGVKLFQASDPGALENHAREISELARTLVPELRRMQHERGGLVTTRTFVGQEGLIVGMKEVMASAARSKGKVMRIIGGAQAEYAYEAFGDWYPEYVKLVAKMGIHKHALVPTSAKEGFARYRTEKNAQLRTVDHGLSSLTYTRITDELVSTEIYRPQLLTIHIRNRAIAQSYVENFELLWKSAKRID